MKTLTALLIATVFSFSAIAQEYYYKVEGNSFKKIIIGKDEKGFDLHERKTACYFFDENYISLYKSIKGLQNGNNELVTVVLNLQKTVAALEKESEHIQFYAALFSAFIIGLVLIDKKYIK